MRAKREVIRKIILDLKENNVCNYCILRFLNEKNADCYKNIDGHIRNLLEEKNEVISNNQINQTDAKKKRHNFCSACLGLLQESNGGNHIDFVVKSVSDAGYDSDNVTFALSLPIAFLLRNRSIWLYLTSKYLDFFSYKNYPHEIKQEYLTVSVKEVWKWLSAEKIASRLNKIANNGVNGNFHVNINVEYEDDEAETACLLKMYPEEFKYRSQHKKKFHGEVLTRKKVESILMDTEIESFVANYSVPPEIPKSGIKFGSVECLHDSIYIAGRYNKLSRNLSQTPWMINGERRMESSVEEIIEKPMSLVIPNSGIKFASSGREDVDVRTLGKGRPFVVDISNPKKTKLDRALLKHIEGQINNSTEVFVRDLQIVQKEDLVNIKDGEETKTKTYTCYCIIKIKNEEDIPVLKNKLEELRDIKDLIIEQRTPIRVLHRRPLAIRSRIIYWLEAKFHEIENFNFFFKLSLKVGAGTYIKEFIHGDFGRTSPNLSEIIGWDTDILALDVEDIALQWPPSLSDNNDKED